MSELTPQVRNLNRDMRVDRWALNGSGEIGDLRCLLAVKRRPDDLFRVAHNRKVRVVRDHDDLPPLLRFGLKHSQQERRASIERERSELSQHQQHDRLVQQREH